MTETQYPLGRNVNHDPRSLSYRVVVSPTATKKTVRWDRQIPVLDQKKVGSCTGNAGCGGMGTQPNSVAFTSSGLGQLDEKWALQLYSDATRVDDDPSNDYPPNDEGSDGLSIATVLKKRGLVSGYQHAFGIDDAYAAIQQGPLLVGIPWYDGMFKPDPQGVVTVSGNVAGGHEVECIGYDAPSDEFEFVNSWGTGWGRLGHFFMSGKTFDSLLHQQGDIILLVPVDQPAPQPTPQPAPADDKAKAKATLDAWAAKKHVGAAKAAADAWKVYSA